MNILASFDWLKDYVSLKETPEQVAARVSLSGPGIEKLYPQGVDLQGIVVGFVKEVGAHPQADKLKIAKVDIGEKKLANIVCGGSNLMEGQWVAVAKVGSKVRWHGEGELIELAPAEIRGVASEGMICAANEIGLFDAFPHAEREILDLGARIQGFKAKAGTPIASVLGLEGDVVMDVEVTTNRPDLLGMVGLAREVATILKQPFTYKASSKIKAGKATLNVKVQDKKRCLRYTAVRIDGIQNHESPWWLKKRLLSAGMRPINIVVDITNFVMLELGQPMHAFDADKLEGGQIVVRVAKAGETMKALDGKEYTFGENQLVIADASKPVAVAGVMGGEETAVTSATSSIVFECAAFDGVSVRRTARALNLYSDAQRLFEKGLSTEALPAALARAVELCNSMCGGTVATKVVDMAAGAYKPLRYMITTKEINALIGVEMKEKEMKDILERLGFKVKLSGGKFTVETPWWRDHDIEDARDLVEEIARMRGYADLPAVMPLGISQYRIDPSLVWEDRVRTTMKGAGFTEVYTYSFVSKKLLENTGYSSRDLVKISNPLSDDFEFMRTSLMPCLAQAVVENQERFRQQRIFEVSRVYFPTQEKGQLPKEELEVGLAVLGGDDAWKQAKGAVEWLLRECGIAGIEWREPQADAFWHPTRSMQAFVGDYLLATVGEIHPEVAARLKIEGRLAMASLPMRELVELGKTTNAYQGIPQFPESKRDIAVVVKDAVRVDALVKAMRSASHLVRSVEWFDTYRGEHVEAGSKSVAFHLVFGLADRTLTTDEVDQAMMEVQTKLSNEFQAKFRA